MSTDHQVKPIKKNFLATQSNQKLGNDLLESIDIGGMHSGEVERFLLSHSAGNASKDRSSQKIDEDNLFKKPQMDSCQQDRIDEYTQELENLYTSCLEWILNRAPSGLFHNLMIDDFDKITFQPALEVLMTLVLSSNNMVRQRSLQDLFMLAQWDSHNGQIILQHPLFHSWLLDLLMQYQDLTTRQSFLSDSSRAVYDMGCKLHTLLLKNACINPEEEAFKKINLLTRWPQVVQE